MDVNRVVRAVFPQSIAGCIWYSVLLSYALYVLVVGYCDLASFEFSIGSLISWIIWSLFANSILVVAAGCAVISLARWPETSTPTANLFGLGAGVGFYLTSIITVVVFGILNVIDVVPALSGESRNCEDPSYRALMAPVYSFFLSLVGIPAGVGVAFMWRRGSR